MRKYILPIIIFISVFTASLLLYRNVIPSGAIRIIVPVTLLAIILAKKIYDNKFSKIDCIVLGVGFILILMLTIQRYLL